MWEWRSGGEEELWRGRFVPSLTCLDTFIHVVVLPHVQYVGHRSHYPRMELTYVVRVPMCSCVSACVRMCSRVSGTTSLQSRLVYRFVMFTKQNNDCKFTDTLCLQNKANKTGRKKREKREKLKKLKKLKQKLTKNRQNWRMCARVRERRSGVCVRMSSRVSVCPYVFSCVRMCSRVSVCVRVCPLLSACNPVSPRVSACDRV